MTLVIAHRGASAYEPENSLAAFRAAVALGADGIELDVHASHDGTLVVHHDDVIDGRPVRDVTTGDLRDLTLSNGESVPTLRETLDTIGPDLIAFIEVKTLLAEHDLALLAAIDEAPRPTNCHVHAFDHRIVQRLHDLRPDITTGVLSASRPIDPVAPMRDAGAEELWQKDAFVDEPLVHHIHQGGAKIYVWTVDAPGRMDTLLGYGVDGICTNKPDVARRIVR